MSDNVIGLVPKAKEETPEHMGDHLRKGLDKMGTLEQQEGSYFLTTYDSEGTMKMFTNITSIGEVLYVMEMLKMSLMTGEVRDASE